MDATTHPFKNSGSNRITFFVHGAISLVILLIAGFFQGYGFDGVLLPLILTPFAAGVSGIIFKNTEELRYSSGVKMAFGWVIGFAGYLVLIPMALAL